MAAKKKSVTAVDVLKSIGEATTSAGTGTEKAAKKRGRKPGSEAKWNKRMNIGTSEEIKEYIMVMSKLRGISINDFVNEIFMHSLEDNRELFQKCRDLAQSIEYSRHDAIGGGTDGETK